MKQDNFYPDCNLALEMASINSSNYIATSISALTEISKNIEIGISIIYQVLTTQQRVSFWQILSTLGYIVLFNYLILLFNVVIYTFV
ncbi:hypothetical protein Nos7524_3641 [Nostoc sp. PCC 7524]|uniref:hypothetical protein n=1 Tax=Nostoc sp. (strain ATCC 29411 / PCC 7524) TaxID=28072 RepID=UPI00029F25FA|nr:hypothetical protein [Nostoc sp. PCC 7524]AFY49428.1 hypothetical protein Nos7524_3641 [Nostoc sp. PCC 7524]